MTDATLPTASECGARSNAWATVGCILNLALSIGSGVLTWHLLTRLMGSSFISGFVGTQVGCSVAVAFGLGFPVVVRRVRTGAW